MKSLVFTAPHAYEIQEISEPALEREQDVKIAVKGIGICGTDMHIYSGKRKVEFPMVAGHELVGYVKEIGSQVQNIQVGDYVTVAPNFSCNVCDFCTGGHANLCLSKKTMGVNLSGCFAEVVIAPANCVYKLPESISVEEGIVIETATVALHAVNKANVKIGDTVLVFGAGTVGNIVAQLSKLSGAVVHVSDTNANRLALATELGVDEVFVAGKDEIPKGYYDVVLDAAGVSATISQAIHAVKNGGTVGYVGIPGNPVELDIMTVIRHELNIFGSVACTDEFPVVIRLTETGQLNLKKLVTHKLSFDELVYGIELMERQEALKPAVIL